MNSRKKRRKRRKDLQMDRGGNQADRRPGMERYVHSRRKGKVRRDRNQTVEQLGQVLKRREERGRAKRKVVLVGTRVELGQRRERRKGNEGRPENRERVTRSWLSGSLTNAGKEERPGMIRFRNPNDHGVGRKEARRSGVPTAGRVDSDSEYVDLRTYPIPGNDESRAGQRRVTRRVRETRKRVE